jgi:ubiquinone/menaquinone biosynthesis C-methylase UbiE
VYLRSGRPEETGSGYLMNEREFGTQVSRVTRSRDEARAAYDKMSRWYDALAGGSEKRLVDVGLQKLQVRPGESVLEIGFGTGGAILALARLVGESGRVYGIDLSAGMLQVAQKKVAEAGLLERVQLGQGDAVLLPFETGSMEVVFMSFTLELFDTPDIPVVLAECRRVLCDSGRLSVVAMSKKGRDGLMLRLYEWAHERFPRHVDCRPIYVVDAVRNAGFQAVESVDASMWGLPVTIATARK